MGLSYLRGEGDSSDTWLLFGGLPVNFRLHGCNLISSSIIFKINNEPQIHHASIPPLYHREKGRASHAQIFCLHFQDEVHYPVVPHALGVIRRDVFHRPCDPDACAAAALFHDASEIFTGDLPTPIKYHSPAIRDAYRQVEAEATEKLLSMLPEELRPAYGPILREEDGEVRRIVKAADKLSAYIKCLEEVEAGTNEFGDAAGETLEALRGMEMEEVSWFLERFAEAFGLTLDGLQRG